MSTTRPILVIGRTGQLGMALADIGGSRIVGLGRPQLDITCQTSISAALERLNPALVINAAAYTAVDLAQEDFEAAKALNTDGPAILAQRCAALDVPLIHLSTDYVFDGETANAYRETDHAAPLGVYGQTKRAGEMAVLAAQPKHIIIRTAWVYSAVGRNFVKTMLQLAARHQHVRVVNDQFGNPTYAPHLARAILHIASQVLDNDEFENWGLYHLTGSGCTHWAEFAQEIFSQSAKAGGATARVEPIPASAYPTPAPRPANSCLDGAKAEEVFNVTLPDWHEGLRECVEELVLK